MTGVGARSPRRGPYLGLVSIWGKVREIDMIRRVTKGGRARVIPVWGARSPRDTPHLIVGTRIGRNASNGVRWPSLQCNLDTLHFGFPSWSATTVSFKANSPRKGTRRVEDVHAHSDQYALGFKAMTYNPYEDSTSSILSDQHFSCLSKRHPIQ